VKPGLVVRGAPVALALALLALAFPCGRALSRSRPILPDRSELNLFPSGPWVRPLAFGRTRLAADLAWLTAIQYYGRHRKTDRRYEHASTLFHTLTGLDPSFENAYVFGALVLSEDAGDPTGARALLREGMAKNPESWLLRFEYGFLLYVQRNDPAEAAEELHAAARMPGAPPYVARLAAFAAGASGKRDLAIELWRQVLQESPNEQIRRMARSYLRRLEAPEAAGFPPEEV